MSRPMGLEEILEALLLAYDDSSAGGDEVMKQAKSAIIDLFLSKVPASCLERGQWESGFNDARTATIQAIEELRK